MKKRTIWISLMSALLCLPLLLAACDNTGDTETESETETSVESGTESGTETATPNEPTVERPTIEDEKINYKELIDRWKEYLTPVGASADDSYVDYSNITIDTPISGNLHGNFTVNESVIDDDPEYPGKKTISVYNNDGFIKKFEYSNYYRTENKWGIKYDFMGTLANGNVMEIKKTVSTSTDLTATPIVWEEKVTYLYYDIDGNKIGEESEIRATDLSHSIILGEKTYHIDTDGHVFFITHVTEAYEIADAYSKTLEISDDEIYRYSVSGNTLQVLNKDYNLTAEFKLSSGDKYYYLDNGNVFVFRATQLANNASEFDFEYSGSKYDVKHMVLDVATGKVAEIEADWIPAKVLTNEGTEEYKIKADCFYAEVNRIVDGKLGNETEFVIFDNQLKEVAKLPSILKNQHSLGDAIDSSSFVITVTRISGSYASYKVNTMTGTVERHVSVTGDYTLDGGYVIGNKVYTDNGTEIFDLSDAKSWNIVAGNLYYITRETYEDASGNTKSTEAAHVGYISSGSFQSNTISTGESVEKISDGEGGWTITTCTESVSYNSTFGLYVVNKTVSETGKDDVQSFRLYNRVGNTIHSADGSAAITSSGNIPQLRVTTSSETTIYTIK